MDRRHAILGIGCVIAAGAALIGTNTDILAQEANAKDPSSLLNANGGITADGYVYQQAFLPMGKLDIDLKHTARWCPDVCGKAEV